jgi:cell division protein FtsZ
MLIDAVADPFNPGQGIAANLRGRSSASEAATPAVADFGGDSSYLDIPAFLRRQAD